MSARVRGFRCATADRDGAEPAPSVIVRPAGWAAVRLVIFDRDGVLNVSPGDGWVADPDGFCWEAGALAALRRLHRAGLRLGVASNQSGVGRGVVTAAALSAIEATMRAGAAGIDFVGILHCPHVPEDGCACRKPKPGMLDALMQRAGVAPRETVFVGDSDVDLLAGEAAGVHRALIRTGHGRKTERGAAAVAVPVFDDLPSFARMIARDPPR